MFLAQRETQGAHRTIQLLHRARADDRRRDGFLVQQPGERHIGLALAELCAQRIIGFQPGTIFLDVFFQIVVRASTDLRRF